MHLLYSNHVIQGFRQINNADKRMNNLIGLKMFFPKNYVVDVVKCKTNINFVDVIIQSHLFKVKHRQNLLLFNIEAPEDLILNFPSRNFALLQS